MQPVPKALLFNQDGYLNLYYLNELYGHVADAVSLQMREQHHIDAPITAGIWGGTYLITNKEGLAKNKIHRMYCIVNLPQNGPLDEKKNLERFMKIYHETLAGAFQPHGLLLNLERWGDSLPYSNRAKPSLIMHFSETHRRVRWLRVFFVWNQAPWEESIIHDTLRNIKVLKELLDINHRPVLKSSEELKFLMQDVIITFWTLEKALSPGFFEHADPIIRELTGHYLAGLNDSELIRELYLKVYNNALIYGLEEALEEPHARAGLNIHHVEDWPVEKINWVPQDLKEKLIPPIQEIFAGFKKNLEKKTNQFSS